VRRDISRSSLGVKKLCYDAIVPTRGSDHSVGYDLYSSEDAMVPSQAGRAIVGTGITVVLPPGVYGRVAPRSGVSRKALHQMLVRVSLTQIIQVKSKLSCSTMERKTLKSRRVIELHNSF